MKEPNLQVIMLGIKGTKQAFKVSGEVGGWRQTEALRAEAHWDVRYVCFGPAGLRGRVALEAQGTRWTAGSKESVSFCCDQRRSLLLAAQGLSLRGPVAPGTVFWRWCPLAVLFSFWKSVFSPRVR